MLQGSINCCYDISYETFSHHAAQIHPPASVPDQGQLLSVANLVTSQQSLCLTHYQEHWLALMHAMSLQPLLAFQHSMPVWLVGCLLPWETAGRLIC